MTKGQDMSEAIVRVTRAVDDGHEIEYDIIATRGVKNLWDQVGEEEAVRLGLPVDPDGDGEIEDTEQEIDGVKYHYWDYEWWTPGDVPETSADGVVESLTEALSDESPSVGDLFAVDIDYEGDGCWWVTVERTTSTVLAEPAEVAA